MTHTPRPFRGGQQRTQVNGYGQAALWHYLDTFWLSELEMANTKAFVENAKREAQLIVPPSPLYTMCARARRGVWRTGSSASLRPEIKLPQLHALMRHYSVPVSIHRRDALPWPAARCR